MNIHAEQDANGAFTATATPELDSGTRAVLDRMNEEGASNLGKMTPEEVRDWMARTVDRLSLSPKPEVGEVKDLAIPRLGEEGTVLQVRLYRPRSANGELLPLVLFIHAGGYVFGDLDTLDDFCRLLCRDAGCLVMAVDYRRAPEHKFPIPLEDCYAATLWASQNAESIGADPARIAMAGDSSGGAMATIVCQLAKLRGGPDICHQFLWYPGVGSAGPSESAEKYGFGFFLQNDLMMWSMKHYLNSKEEMMDHRVQALLFEDKSGLPPTFLMTAGYDPRRDDNRIYAEQLRDAGVPVVLRCIESTIHGFLFMMGGIEVARAAAEESAAYVRKVLF